MQQLQIVTLRDKALGAYMTPWFTQSVGQAYRIFQDICNDKSHDVGKHPSDYELFHLGSWQDSGQFELLPQPKLLASGDNMKGS